MHRWQRMLRTWLVLSALVGALIGCRQGIALLQPSPTPIPSPTPSPTMTVTPSPTATATITPTPTATPTPRPIWRQIQTITLPDGREPLIASLSPDGKYLVVASWLTNTQKGVPLRLYLWEVGKPTPLWEIQLPRIQADTGWVDAFEWIPEYNLLGVTGRDTRWWYFLLNISTGSVDWVYSPGSSADMKHEPVMLWITERNELLINTPNRYLRRFRVPSMTDEGRWQVSDNPKCCFLYRMERDADSVYVVAREAYTRYYRLFTWPVANPKQIQDFKLDLSSNGKITDMAVNNQQEVGLIYWAYSAETQQDTTRGRIVVFSGTTGKAVMQIRKEYDFPEALEWLSGKGWAVAWAQEVWLLTSSSQNILLTPLSVQTFRGLTASANGNRVALYGTDWVTEKGIGTIEVWEWR